MVTGGDYLPMRDPLIMSTRHGIQVYGYFICRISRWNWVFQLADFRRVLMLPLDLLARRRPSAKRRTTAMFLAPWPARERDRSSLNPPSSTQCMLSTPQWPRDPAASRSMSSGADEM